tara:strand:+ start:20 stop:745 length:726 start_codon:yes stop_codon:yes gene_type:complete
MINDINKLLFLDIETVGIEDTLDSLHNTHPNLYKLWEETGYDYCKRRYPKEDSLSSDEMFIKKAALLPEFGKIVCVSVGFILQDGEIKLDSYVGDEKVILSNTITLFNRVNKLGFRLCGHNIKSFDLPYIGKKILVHQLPIPDILPTYNDKPWETRVVDTKEVWNFNSYIGLSSLDLVCAALGIHSPKNGHLKGENMHHYYYDWPEGKEVALGIRRDDNIKEYCEKDVIATINLVKNISSC